MQQDLCVRYFSVFCESFFTTQTDILLSNAVTCRGFSVALESRYISGRCGAGKTTVLLERKVAGCVDVRVTAIINTHGHMYTLRAVRTRQTTAEN